MIWDVDEKIAALMCSLWPDSSVYIIKSCDEIWRSRCWWAFAASSLLTFDIVVTAFSFHHGDRIYASMRFMSVCMYLKYCLAKFFRFDRYEKFPCFIACAIHAWIEWSAAVIVIRVTVRRILFVRRHCGESKSVSCFMTVIAVVRKHPVIVRMTLPWTDESARSCAVVDAVRVSPGLCHIIAA